MSVKAGSPGTNRLVTFLNSRFKNLAVLLLLAIVCASVNLNKPVHMDDTAYLEIAQAILHSPLHPMSQEVNWHQTARPIFRLNQPHAIIYLFALTLLVFGDSLPALHVVMAVLALCATFCIYILARLLTPRHALWITAVLVLGPAFLPGQNLMFDIPLVGLWALFFWAILRSSEGTADHSLAAGAAVAAVACLVKYVSLVLLPILLLTILIRRRWRSLWVLAIPALVLIGWSAFNYLDYGAVHLLQRNTPEFSARAFVSRTLDWIAGLGAVALFAPFLMTLLESRRLKIGLLFLALAAGLTVLVGIQWRAVALSRHIPVLCAVFAANGILTLCLTLLITAKGTLQGLRTGDSLRIERSLVLILWLSGAAAFVVLFAPFLAIRHVLPALPAVLLLLVHNLEGPVPRRTAIAALVTSSAFGLLLALSDYQYANVHRAYAPIVKSAAPADARIFFTGHWGWQWYARKEGMKQYHAERTVLREGDYVVTTELLHQADVRLPRGLALAKVREWQAPSTALTLFRTMAVTPWGGYYMYRLSAGSPPWRLSTAPLETFVLQKAAGSGN